MKIKVNGVELYYQKLGVGNPIILLHGNGENSQIFQEIGEKLATEFEVYLVDSRGHGESSPVSKYHYEDMMTDIYQFIVNLNITKPIILGFSDGGIIGLMLAIKYRNLLSKLIVCGANINPNGIKLRYSLLMNIKHLFTRDSLNALMVKEPDIREKDLKKISVPTLVLAGEKDLIKEEHTKVIADNIKKSTLKIVSKETHTSYVLDNLKLYRLIEEFIFAS